MQPTSEIEYIRIFTQLIKKQILILGPDITLAKVRTVPGLTVDADGNVLKIEGDAQAHLQSLINQFVELSGIIVKKTMESLLPPTSSFSEAAVSASIVSIPSETPEPSDKPVTIVDSLPKLEIDLTPTLSDDKPVFSKPVGPPAMSEMKFASLAPPASSEPKKADADTASFSPDEMADLNKALEDLSKSPLSSENTPMQTSNASPPSQI